MDLLQIKSFRYNLFGTYKIDGLVEGKFMKLSNQNGAEFYIPEKHFKNPEFMDTLPVNGGKRSTSRKRKTRKGGKRSSSRNKN